MAAIAILINNTEASAIKFIDNIAQYDRTFDEVSNPIAPNSVYAPGPHAAPGGAGNDKSSGSQYSYDRNQPWTQHWAPANTSPNIAYKVASDNANQVVVPMYRNSIIPVWPAPPHVIERVIEKPVEKVVEKVVEKPSHKDVIKKLDDLEEKVKEQAKQPVPEPPEVPEPEIIEVPASCSCGNCDCGCNCPPVQA